MCVLKSKEVSKLAGGYAAERGRVFVRARVRYVAEAAYDYNYLDWMAHDDKGTKLLGSITRPVAGQSSSQCSCSSR